MNKVGYSNTDGLLELPNVSASSWKKQVVLLRSDYKVSVWHSGLSQGTSNSPTSTALLAQGLPWHSSSCQDLGMPPEPPQALLLHSATSAQHCTLTPNTPRNPLVPQQPSAPQTLHREQPIVSTKTAWNPKHSHHSCLLATECRTQEYYCHY